MDFSRHKTFSFVDPAEIGEKRTPDEAALKDRIEPAISQQLQAKDLRQVGADRVADLSVYYWVDVITTWKRAWQNGYGHGPTYGGATSSYS
ncbi:hypothetical protein YTPLAS18_28950 [Nitrospira sp.]|nr:hypothetical protein YTPLAS18_28950 [Nitrospira sp.]